MEQQIEQLKPLLSAFADLALTIQQTNGLVWQAVQDMGKTVEAMIPKEPEPAPAPPPEPLKGIIETGVRIPHRQMPTRHRFPQIAQIEAGQSFFIPGGDVTQVSHCTQNHVKYNPDKVFENHTVIENGTKGVRCFRTK